MGMSPFDDQFPEVAGREMFVLHVIEEGLPLPLGEYAFLERYCVDPGCDCRRALFEVFSPQFPGRILATINYGWESEAFYTRWMHGDRESAREIISASLDPINPNSELADPLLDAFRDYVEAHPEANQQLKRHYAMFKAPQKKRRGGRR
jgi:hypothetical protein